MICHHLGARLSTLVVPRRVLVPYLTLSTNPTLGSQHHQTPNHHVYHELLHEDKVYHRLKQQIITQWRCESLYTAVASTCTHLIWIQPVTTSSAPPHQAPGKSKASEELSSYRTERGNNFQYPIVAVLNQH